MDARDMTQSSENIKFKFDSTTCGKIRVFLWEQRGNGQSVDLAKNRNALHSFRLSSMEPFNRNFVQNFNKIERRDELYEDDGTDAQEDGADDFSLPPTCWEDSFIESPDGILDGSILDCIAPETYQGSMDLCSFLTAPLTNGADFKHAQFDQSSHGISEDSELKDGDHDFYSSSSSSRTDDDRSDLVGIECLETWKFSDVTVPALMSPKIGSHRPRRPERAAFRTRNSVHKSTKRQSNEDISQRHVDLDSDRGGGGCGGCGSFLRRVISVPDPNSGTLVPLVDLDEKFIFPENHITVRPKLHVMRLFARFHHSIGGLVCESCDPLFASGFDFAMSEFSGQPLKQLEGKITRNFELFESAAKMNLGAANVLNLFTSKGSSRQVYMEWIPLDTSRNPKDDNTPDADGRPYVVIISYTTVRGHADTVEKFEGAFTGPNAQPVSITRRRTESRRPRGFVRASADAAALPKISSKLQASKKGNSDLRALETFASSSRFRDIVSDFIGQPAPDPHVDSTRRVQKKVRQNSPPPTRISPRAHFHQLGPSVEKYSDFLTGPEPQGALDRSVYEATTLEIQAGSAFRHGRKQNIESSSKPHCAVSV
jgi:hypothetical protein